MTIELRYLQRFCMKVSKSNTIRFNTQYKSELQTDLQKMEMQLRAEIKDTKTDMIKWFFAFFVTLVLMILGLYATILMK